MNIATIDKYQNNDYKPKTYESFDNEKLLISDYKKEDEKWNDNYLTKTIDNFAETISSSVDRTSIFTDENNQQYNHQSIIKLTKEPWIIVKDSLNININENPFIKFYFSRQNMDIMQKLIKQTVYKKSNFSYIIPELDEMAILNYMQYIWVNYSNNPLNFNDFSKEIRRLDQMTINMIVPGLINNINNQLSFNKQESQFIPIPYGEFTSTTGKEELHLS